MDAIHDLRLVFSRPFGHRHPSSAENEHHSSEPLGIVSHSRLCNLHPLTWTFSDATMRQFKMPPRRYRAWDCGRTTLCTNAALRSPLYTGHETLQSVVPILEMCFFFVAEDYNSSIPDNCFIPSSSAASSSHFQSCETGIKSNLQIWYLSFGDFKFAAA